MPYESWFRHGACHGIAMGAHGIPWAFVGFYGLSLAFRALQPLAFMVQTVIAMPSWKGSRQCHENVPYATHGISHIVPPHAMLCLPTGIQRHCHVMLTPLHRYPRGSAMAVGYNPRYMPVPSIPMNAQGGVTALQESPCQCQGRAIGRT